MSRFSVRAIAAVILGFTMIGGGFASAEGQQLSAPTVTPSEAAPGETVTISGGGCHGSPAEVIVKVADWAPVTDAELNDGSWSVKVTVPADAAPGSKTVAATCDYYSGTTEYPAATLKVVAKDNEDSAKATVTVDVDSVVAGGSLTVNGGGFDAGEKVSATLFSDPVKLGELTADSDGAVSDTLTIPVTVAAGVHRLELRGLSSDRVASTEITVTEASGGTPTDGTTPTGTTQDDTDGGSTGNLAFTGSSAILLATVGLMTVLLGAGLLVMRRRRIA